MRFILNTKKRSPSFGAKQDAYVFASMIIGQISAVLFCGLLLWTFLPFVDAGIFASCLLVFLAAAFYLSYRSVQFSQLVILLSALGSEVLMLFSNPFALDPNLILIVFLLLDVAILFVLYVLNIQYPLYLGDKPEKS